MTRINYIYCAFIALCVLLSACTDEINLPSGGNAADGEPVVINMSFKASNMEKRTRAALSDSEEKEIESIAIFIFDGATGALVSQTIHENAGAHASDGNGVIKPDGSNKMPIETLAGNNRTICVIANYHSNTITGLKEVSNLTDLNALVAEVLGNPMDREFGIIKVGTLSGQEVRKGIPITVPLTFLSAKITIKILNKSTDLIVAGWSADGIPRRSYLAQRPIGSDPNYHDAADIQNSEHYFYELSEQTLDFDKQPNNYQPGDPSATTPQYETSFYMYENRRGGRVVRDEPPTGWPNGDPTDATVTRAAYQLKAWYAPENASRIRIMAQERTGGVAQKALTINHYLGENNHDNYDITRGTHYTYTITINGLTSIDIDTNVEQYDVELGVLPPASLMNMDAHADSRPFVLRTDIITNPDAVVSAELLLSTNSDIHPEWVDLSLFPSSFHHIRDNATPSIATWQQEGPDKTYVRPKFIPNQQVRQTLGSSYVTPSGITIGSTAYPADDTSLPYTLATHRMCKKITDIATKGNTSGGLTEPVTIYLNTNEFVTNGSDFNSFREAVIRFTIQIPGQKPHYSHYSIRQYPPHLFVKAPDGTGSTLLVERTEEYEHFTHAAMPIKLQFGAGMQWGSYITAATNENNGFNNTLLGVYQSTSTDYFKASNYRSPKYGSKDRGWVAANNGKIPEGTDLPSASYDGGTDFKYPKLDNTSSYNIIYNTTAARYCHEKNRDINGDGNIDASETHWYLPASDEVQLFWTYHETLKLKPDYYWSSTQQDDAKAYAYSMHQGTASPHLIYNGVRQPLAKTFVATIGPPRVRCVRKAPLVGGTSPQPIKPIVSRRVDGKTVIDCSSLTSEMYSTQSKYNILPKDVAEIQHANTKVYKRFEIQSTENTAVDYVILTSGKGQCNNDQGWRLPTQRELLLIYSVRAELQALPGFTAFATEKYWSGTWDIGSKYLVDFGTGEAMYGPYLSHATDKFHYRCVREMP